MEKIKRSYSIKIYIFTESYINIDKISFLDWDKDIDGSYLVFIKIRVVDANKSKNGRRTSVFTNQCGY